MMGGLMHPKNMCCDELVFRLRDALMRRRLEGWSLKFAISIVGRAKRPSWSPTDKQIAAMRRVITELRSPNPDYAGEVDLIDHSDSPHG